FGAQRPVIREQSSTTSRRGGPGRTLGPGMKSFIVVVASWANDSSDPHWDDVQVERLKAASFDFFDPERPLQGGAGLAEPADGRALYLEREGVLMTTSTHKQPSMMRMRCRRSFRPFVAAILLAGNGCGSDGDAPPGGAGGANTASSGFGGGSTSTASTS